VQAGVVASADTVPHVVPPAQVPQGPQASVQQFPSPAQVFVPEHWPFAVQLVPQLVPEHL